MCSILIIPTQQTVLFSQTADSSSSPAITMCAGVSLISWALNDYSKILKTNNYDVDYRCARMFGDKCTTTAGTNFYFMIDYSFNEYFGFGLSVSSIGRIIGHDASVEGLRYELFGKNYGGQSAIRETHNTINYSAYMTYALIPYDIDYQWTSRTMLGAGITNIKAEISGYDPYSLVQGDKMSFSKQTFFIFGMISLDYWLSEYVFLGSFLKCTYVPPQQMDEIHLLSKTVDLSIETGEVFQIYATLPPHKINFSDVTIGLQFGVRSKIFE